jgi:glycosyltransferase involved in cell wall biosynthesis
LWFGSHTTKEAWKEYGLDGDVVYWSGIPSQSLSEKSESPIKNFLSVGTASGRKGIHYLIEAFLYCLEKGLIPHDVTLAIVGFPNSSSPDFVGFEDLILRVATSQFKERIQLVGAVPPGRLDQYFQKADLFIQSSLLESLPISLLTAMSKGLPIISTDVNGCAEAIQHGRNGYLCLPYNRLSLANAMIEVVNHPKKSREMGRSAQQDFNERFSLEVTRPIILKNLTLK